MQLCNVLAGLSFPILTDLLLWVPAQLADERPTLRNKAAVLDARDRNRAEISMLEMLSGCHTELTPGVAAADACRGGR